MLLYQRSGDFKHIKMDISYDKLFQGFSPGQGGRAWRYDEIDLVIIRLHYVYFNNRMIRIFGYDYGQFLNKYAFSEKYEASLAKGGDDA